MSMKTAPTSIALNKQSNDYRVAQASAMKSVHAGSIFYDASGNKREVLYSKDDNVVSVDKHGSANAPTVQIGISTAQFLRAHADHRMTHVGQLTGVGTADVMYCQADDVLNVDTLT